MQKFICLIEISINRKYNFVPGREICRNIQIISKLIFYLAKTELFIHSIKTFDIIQYYLLFFFKYFNMNITALFVIIKLQDHLFLLIRITKFTMINP